MFEKDDRSRLRNKTVLSEIEADLGAREVPRTVPIHKRAGPSRTERYGAIFAYLSQGMRRFMFPI